MSNEVDNLFYWLILGITATLGKVTGVFAVIIAALPDIAMPVHQVKYLPQLEDALPAFIIAGGCAFISAIINKLVGMAFNKFKTSKHDSSTK